MTFPLTERDFDLIADTIRLLGQLQGVEQAQLCPCDRILVGVALVSLDAPGRVRIEILRRPGIALWCVEADEERLAGLLRDAAREVI